MVNKEEQLFLEVIRAYAKDTDCYTITGTEITYWDKNNSLPPPSKNAINDLTIKVKLDKAKQSKLIELAAMYETANQANIAYMNTTFQADSKSQDAMTKVLTASGGKLPAEFFWVDTANNQVPMSHADLQGLAAAILARGQKNFAYLQQLKASVKSATTLTELEAITW